MTKLYINKITGVEREMTEAAFNHLLPIYNQASNSMVEKQGFVLAPSKPKGKKAKEIIKEANNG